MSQVPPPPSQQPQYSPPQPMPGAPNAGYGPPPAKQTNGPAIGSLVSGVLGCIPLVAGLLAIILGVIGIRKTRDPNVGGKGMAIAGLILGIVSLLFWGIFAVAGGAGLLIVSKATAPGRDAAKAWMTAVSSGDLKTAAAKSVSNFPEEDLQTLHEHLKGAGTFTDMTSSNIQLNNGVLSLEGVATFSGGQRSYEIVVVQEGGVWKVQTANVE